MKKNGSYTGDGAVLEKQGLQKLLDILNTGGYKTIGPTVRNGAVTYDEVRFLSELPVGWNDVQGAGTYRLERSERGTLFGYVVGPHSWKKFLYPAVARLWAAKRHARGFEVLNSEVDVPKYAFIGARSCELHGMAIHDTVFRGGRYSDPHYNARREKLFIVAVNCTRPGGTCFCYSMGTGPKVESGFDIALTEVCNDSEHYFVAEAGTGKGAEILDKVSERNAMDKDKAVVKELLEKAVNQMGRALATSNLDAIFHEHFQDLYWDEVAKRCLTCGNCTMVCPTCFCANIEDVNSLDGNHAERWRKWDSCFSKDFSYIHGGSIRFSEKARYRQWLTHKLVTWVDQFGTSGCVGCGRCITWCPVGIDITEEARAILKESRNRVA